MQDVLADKRDSYVDILTCFDVNWLKRRDPDPNYIINTRDVSSRKIMIPSLVSEDNNKKLKNK
ncbi:MAG: hypothetical protein CL912_14540 [Deltaproteobacteria bacterium]|nr:hypothetical protein [Deltaproteobacteria bacterium]